MILLAEIPAPASVELAGWLVCFISVVIGVNAVLKLFDRLKGEKALPANETLGHAHTTLVRRVDGHASDIDALRREFAENVKDQDRKDSTHRAGLYRKIEESEQKLRQEIKDLRTENSQKMEANRAELSQDIKDMPAQVIALLKNTGAI